MKEIKENLIAANQKMEPTYMMKLRYLFGIPYLFFLGMMGGDIIYDALVIGVLAGFTDIYREGGNGPRFGG